MKFLTGAQTNVLHLDMLTEHIILLGVVATQPNHALRQLNDSYRFTHVQHKHISTSAQGASLEHQLSGFTDTHKVPRDFRMRNRDRATRADLLSEQRHN